VGNNGAAESNAVWVFNTANQAQGGVQNLFDLTSAAAVADVTKVANLDLTVSFRGINVTVGVGDTHSSSGGTVNDLVINQAIKEAINNDVYLGKLLSAEDGPGHTLVVTALTDGVFSDADISVSVANPTALSVAQAGAGAAYLTAAQLTALGLTGGSAVAGGRFDSAIAEDAAGTAITGAVSVEANENNIVAGQGNDVVVLSTSTLAHETVNVAAAGGADADVVFNASAGASITYDQSDTIITSDGTRIFGGVGTVTLLTNLIEGSEGNDTINASIATVGQSIDGKAGNDIIIGSAFNDNITGGQGGDKMNGGAGADTFVIGNTDSGLVIASADEITGFVSGTDKLGLGVAGDDTAITGNYVEAATEVADFTAAKTAADTALSTLAGTSSATELYAFQWDSTNGYLFNDTDGNGTADQVVVLTGVTGAGIAASDIVADSGVVPPSPPVVPGAYTPVDLGSTDVTATAAAESFIYDFQMVGGRATKAGDGEVTITGFDVAKDKLVFNDVGTGAVYTEAQFKALPGVVVAENPFANNTSIYFDPVDGVLGGVTLTGVVDAALANIVLETTV